MESQTNLFGELPVIVFQLVLAFIGGGILTSWITERWSRRRERAALLVDRASALMRTYHVYVRLVRQDATKRSESDLARIFQSIPCIGALDLR